jgi:hypothetical protein
MQGHSRHIIISIRIFFRYIHTVPSELLSQESFTTPVIDGLMHKSTWAHCCCVATQQYNV